MERIRQKEKETEQDSGSLCVIIILAIDKDRIQGLVGAIIGDVI